MACLLEPGKDRIVCDATGKEGAQPRVFLRSPDAKLLKVTSLEMQCGAAPARPVSVAKPPFELLALAKGANLLIFSIENVMPKNQVQLVESCGPGEERVLSTRSVRQAQGGADPVMRFTIDGQ